MNFSIVSVCFGFWASIKRVRYVGNHRGNSIVSGFAFENRVGRPGLGVALSPDVLCDVANSNLRVVGVVRPTESFGFGFLTKF